MSPDPTTPPTATRVVLISHCDWEKDNPTHDELLLRLARRNLELFCVVGQDCQPWEDVMDETCVWHGNGPDDQDVPEMTTTSHPDETLEEVVEFAENWLPRGGAVEVIEVG